jgi:hypothetical protein
MLIENATVAVGFNRVNNGQQSIKGQQMSVVQARYRKCILKNNGVIHHMVKQAEWHIH